MKVIIAGSRHLNIKDGSMDSFVDAFKETFGAVTEVVSGGAKGIDASGESFAVRNGLPVKRFDADWKKHGKAAGPIRNSWMARYADALILIWDGESRGSKDMLAAAKDHDLALMQIMIS